MAATQFRLPQYFSRTDPSLVGECLPKSILSSRFGARHSPSLLKTGQDNVSCRAIKIDRSRKKREDAIQSEGDLELCPAECVRELKSERELELVLEFGKRRGVLVVIDFFRTACGSCKYIEQGFAKLCRAEGDQQVPVMFFKHNVMDDREEMSDIADKYRIKSVPLFHFYKDGKLVESFHTRDKARILETINQHIDHDIHDFLT